MDTAVLRNQLLKLLEGKNAHISFQKTLANFPPEAINSKVPGISYSSWELIEHMRLAQFDILDFIINPDYKERKWPDDYWPSKNMKADAQAWQKTIDGFLDDLQTLKDIVNNPKTDFTAPLPHAPKYNILREILLVADHNSYHTGQIILLRRALKIY